MKLLTIVLAVLVAPGMVTAFGERGAAERALYYLLYLGEELLPAEQRTLATACPGSRDGGRCYYGEFLKHIEPVTTELNVDKVIILKTTNELGWSGFLPGWAEQEDILHGEGKFSDPKTVVEALGETIMNEEYGELSRKNPPPQVIEESWERWLAANPNWDKNMENTGPGKTNPVVFTKNGITKVNPVGFPTGYRPYRNFLNYVRFDGSVRTTSPADFQNFFSTMSNYQNRIHERVSGMSEEDPERMRGLQLLEKISLAADRALELRVKDHWKIVVDGMDTPTNNIEKGMRHPSNFGQYVETDTVHGRWGSYDIPNMQKTIDAAVAHHLFSTKEAAMALWQEFTGSPSSIDHMNMINTFNDEFGRFRGHETALDRVC